MDVFQVQMTKFPLVLLIVILAAGCVPLRSYVSEEKPITEPEVEKVSQTQEDQPARLIRVAVVVHHPLVELVIPSQFDLSGISPDTSKVIYKNGEKFMVF